MSNSEKDKFPKLIPNERWALIEKERRSEAPTPIPALKQQSHEKRIAELEESFGGILRETSAIQYEQRTIISKARILTSRVEVLELAEIPMRDREDSQTNISLHPNRLRMEFKNAKPWVIVSIVIVAGLLTVIVAVTWLLMKK